MSSDGGDDGYDDSPIEQVKNTIPTTDDPTLPCLTFRTWILGPITCVFSSFINQYAMYRATPINIPIAIIRIVLMMLGQFMAATLPTKSFQIPGTTWNLNMNPGPFNVKENILLNILAQADTPDCMSIIAIRKIFYHKPLDFFTSLLLILSTQVICLCLTILQFNTIHYLYILKIIFLCFLQMLCYGFAGIFMKFLLYNPYMWYPLTLLDVSFYRYILIPNY